jgi:hypothetical protein
MINLNNMYLKRVNFLKLNEDSSRHEGVAAPIKIKDKQWEDCRVSAPGSIEWNLALHLS